MEWEIFWEMIEMDKRKLRDDELMARRTGEERRLEMEIKVMKDGIWVLEVKVGKQRMFDSHSSGERLVLMKYLLIKIYF